jgi:hypothetical protein
LLENSDFSFENIFLLPLTYNLAFEENGTATINPSRRRLIAVEYKNSDMPQKYQNVNMIEL